MPESPQSEDKERGSGHGSRGSDEGPDKCTLKPESAALNRLDEYALIGHNVCRHLGISEGCAHNDDRGQENT